MRWADTAAFRFAGSAVACAALVLALGTLAPRVSLDAWYAFALAFVAVSAEILLLARFAPTPRPRVVLALAALAAGVVALLAGREAEPWSAAGLTFALGAGTTLIGAALGARIEKPGQLVAVGLVSSIADLWSVFDPSAPSARMAEQALAAPEQLTAFALPFPLLGTPFLPPVIGAGDVLFAALYVAAFRVHGLSSLRVLFALGCAFAVGLAALLATESPLPLLPLLAASVLAVEPAARALDRREWRTVLAVCALLLAAIALRVAR